MSALATGQRSSRVRSTPTSPSASRRSFASSRAASRCTSLNRVVPAQLACRVALHLAEPGRAGGDTIDDRALRDRHMPVRRADDAADGHDVVVGLRVFIFRGYIGWLAARAPDSRVPSARA
jgi:hypothetical protein